MVEPLTGHPAADRVTPDALVVEQGRSVVPLSTWVADAAVVAASDGRILQVLTPADARITYPLELMLAEGGGQWIVRAPGNGFRDGFTGAPMGWTGTRFAPVDGPVPEPVCPDPADGGLELQISTLHPASSLLELGATTEAAAWCLTGAAPLGWGTAEPATQRWSARELTAQCRDRAPEPTSLVVVAGRPRGRAVGRLHARRVTSGVLEELRLAGPPARSVGQAEIEELVEDVAGTARSMIVGVHPVRVNGARPSVPSPPAVPYGIMVGHPMMAERGTDHARRAPASSVRLLGRGGVPACWCRLGTGSATPFEELAAVLHHFRPDPEEQ